MELEGHTYKVWMLVNIDKIMRVFIKIHIPNAYASLVNYLLSFYFFVKSFEEEIQPYGDLVDTVRG